MSVKGVTFPDYKCPCDAVPRLEDGHIKVTHQKWCRFHPDQLAAAAAARTETAA